MTLTEFKAWFEGYTENISKQPTQKQWARIQERVGEIEPEVTPLREVEKHYYDRRPWWPTWYLNSPNYTFTNGTSGKSPMHDRTIWCSNNAREIGRIEAQSTS